MRTVLGKVVDLTGEAKVVNEQGQYSLLKAGDLLHVGDQLITIAGSLVSMQADNGETIRFTGQQAVRLTDALSENAVDISEHAVNPAVIQHVLSALQLDDPLIDLSPPLASLLQEDVAEFVALNQPSITEPLLPAHSQAEALNIHDVLVSGDHAGEMSSQGLPMTHMTDLVTQTTIVTDLGLPDSPLKDFN